MVTRLLLAVVAFLTGLAVQSAPAEARVCGLSGTQVGAPESPAAALRAATQRQRTGFPAVRGEAPALDLGCRPPTLPAVQAPSVRLRADRARE